METRDLALLEADMAAQRVIIDRVFTLLSQRSENLSPENLMMTKPWLSVLIPTYNGESYLPSALESIISQEDNDIECIVVDDGSTDATLSILNAYQDRLSIKILQRERQGNWVANTNYALSFARGEYVCFLHQDDLWFKGRLNIMKGLIEQLVIRYIARNRFQDSVFIQVLRLLYAVRIYRIFDNN